VIFVLAKTDAYPGWRTILADNQAQLQAPRPRFGSAPWFPVSARLAELAMTLGSGTGAADLVAESRIAELQHALVELAGRGHVLALANVLRAIRSELIRMELQVADKVRATDPDPAEVDRAKADRAALAPASARRAGSGH
jgi:hypothetical protein